MKLDFFIIGAHKSSTTTLYDCLRRHPALWLPVITETHYFGRDDLFAQGLPYLSMAFAEIPSGRLVGGKYVHTMYLPKALNRVKDHNPAIRLIAILRNPIDRAYSSYWFARGHGWEALSFEDAILAEKSRSSSGYLELTELTHISHGFYSRQLSHCFELFAKEQIHVILMDDFRMDPLSVLKNLFNFLEVDEMQVGDIDLTSHRNKAAMPRISFINRMIYAPNAWHKRVARRLVGRELRYAFQKHVTERIMAFNARPFRYPPMNRRTRETLQRIYEPYNRELEVLLGRSLSCWK